LRDTALIFGCLIFARRFHGSGVTDKCTTPEWCITSIKFRPDSYVGVARRIILTFI
jgi:hypothetical protein